MGRVKALYIEAYDDAVSMGMDYKEAETYATDFVNLCCEFEATSEKFDFVEGDQNEQAM